MLGERVRGAPDTACLCFCGERTYFTRVSGSSKGLPGRGGITFLSRTITLLKFLVMLEG